MYKPFTAQLYSIGGNKNENGDFIESATFVKNIDCDIQPYSKELFLKTYGYTVECTKRIFCDLDININIGSVFKYKTPLNTIEIYTITKIINWDNTYLEMAALEVDDRWNLSQT